MKKNLILTFIVFLFSLTSIDAQTTENFDARTVGSSTFTNGLTFNLTPNSTYKVATIPGNFGYLSSANYIENPNANPASITSTSTFKVSSLYLYPSSNAGSTNQTSSVSITFTGKLAGVTQFTYTPPAADFSSADYNNATNRGFSLVNFSTPGHQNTLIDELVTDIGGSGNYFAIDNFTFTQSVLPVSLNEFTAKLQTNGSVSLIWDTFSELNNDYFEISKSTNGQDFGVISIIKGKGTSAKRNTYSHLDKVPFNGDNYYKLVQVDLDGKRTEFGIRSVKIGLTGEAKVIIYPNPSNNFINLSYKKGEFFKASLLDLSGKLIISESITQTSESLSFNLSDLPSSIYLIKLEGKEKVVSKQVVKN